MDHCFVFSSPIAIAMITILPSSRSTDCCSGAPCWLAKINHHPPAIIYDRSKIHRRYLVFQSDSNSVQPVSLCVMVFNTGSKNVKSSSPSPGSSVSISSTKSSLRVILLLRRLIYKKRIHITAIASTDGGLDNDKLPSYRKLAWQASS